MAATDLLTLAEARAGLRLATADISRDADITATFIPAVTTVVEDLVGPVVTRSVTYTADGGRGSVLLPSPVAAITSITDNGVTLTGSDYVVDKPKGIIYRGTMVASVPFTPGRQSVVVTYDSGICANTAAVPAPIKLAARAILSALYQVEQQGYRPDFGSPDGSTTKTPSGYEIPRRAYQLLEPFAAGQMPGFA